MKIENKLALVWRDDDIYLAYPLDRVSNNLYKKLSGIFGSPIGRTETFINLERYNTPKSKLEKILERNQMKNTKKVTVRTKKVNSENICINCGHSFSTEFNQLICVLDKNKHKVVGGYDSCNDFN